MDKRQAEFISNLKYYRSIRGISQAKLAELCECGTGTIGSIESARQYPSFELLFKISDALSIHPADLFLRETSIPNDKLRDSLKIKINQIIDETLLN